MFATPQMDVGLDLRLEADARMRNATFTRGDPYRKNRKCPRGYNADRHTRRAFFAVVTARKVEAQQEIEQWLSRLGVRWHQLARVIATQYRGDWAKIEDAVVRWGHVKGGVSAYGKA